MEAQEIVRLLAAVSGSAIRHTETGVCELGGCPDVAVTVDNAAPESHLERCPWRLARELDVTAAPALDHDPAALAWARAKVLEVTGQWRARAARMAGTDLLENAEKWRLMTVAVENTMVGGKTDELGVFDERHAR